MPEIKEINSENEAPNGLIPEPVINSVTDQKIVDLIAEYVQPAVEQDGGAIHFQSFNEDSGQVTVVLKRLL